MAEFIEWLTGTHKCSCGAAYNVTVTAVPTGDVTCEKCGVLIVSSVNKRFLIFERVPPAVE